MHVMMLPGGKKRGSSHVVCLVGLYLKYSRSRESTANVQLRGNATQQQQGS
jgi:hypothetical protein